MPVPVIPDIPVGSQNVAQEGGVATAMGGADAQTAANVPLHALAKFNGASFDRERIITKFVQIQALAVTHATPADVYTPTSGKKFRLLGYQLSSSAAAAIQFEDGTGTEVLRTPLLAAAGVISSGSLGNGILSGAVNTHLFLDVTATSTLSGWIAICEE